MRGKIFFLQQILFLSFGLFLSHNGIGQTNISASLSEEEFVGILRKFHPVIKQADAGIDVAKGNLLASRGQFDPEVNYQLDRKTFDGRNYFVYINPEIRIPTWYGIEIKGGAEDNNGDFINPEVTRGISSYLGIKLPVGKNLLMDERRAALQQAKLFVDLSRNNRELIINDLVYHALSTYYSWTQEYRQLLLMDSIVKINEQRFSFVKLSWRQGDSPAIDTTEALAQLQNFIIQRQHAYLDFITHGYLLSNYLWLENNVPFDMNEFVIPSQDLDCRSLLSDEIPLLEKLVDDALSGHPKLKSYDYKFDILDIEKKLSFQSMLPKVDLKANMLNKDYYVWKGLSTQMLENNYKFGIDVSIPLRFSEGRGKYKATNMKIRETDFELFQVRQELINKLKSVYREVQILQQQLQTIDLNYNNYLRLFKGEESRFRIGESSLFLLNSRENKMLEVRQKQIEMQVKYLKAKAALIWATGQLR